MKKIKIDRAIQERPATRKQTRNEKIRQSLTEHVDVQVIPAITDREGYEKPKLRVCAYCRVSTDMDTQALSYELQVQNYTDYIRGNDEWQFAGIYADRGISGTSLKHRDEFNRMIEDCKAGKIDLIITKAVTRFARNVLDCISTIRMLKQLEHPVAVYFETERINTLDTVDALQYIRELKDLGISVYFESENIDTLTPGGEVLLTILAAMAEQESRTISSNIKWAWQRKFQKGDIILNTGLMLGYRKIGKDDEGHDVYEINEEEAEIVRRIYREFIAGYSITQIAKRLQADGVKTKLGKESWRHNVIESILTNEKYTGNALLGKTFKPDVLTKYRQKNDGKKAPIYYVEGSHPAIIEKGLFDLAQQEMQRRRDVNDNKVGGGRYSSRYPFSGMLVCGICGSKLRRQVRTMGSGKRKASWGCCNRINNGRAECDSHHVNEDVLEATYLTAMRKLVDSAEEVVEVVRDGAELALEPENKAAMERIDEETIQLQEAALALHKAKQRMEIGAVEYASRVKEYSERMKELEAERNELQGTAAKYAEVRMWLDTFIEQAMQSDTLTTVDGTTMKMLVDRIHVRNDGIVVEFKCGVAIEQEYVK